MVIPKPPILIGQQPVQDLQEFYVDRGWTGYDLYHPADQVDIGYFTQGDNLYTVGDLLMIRPGKQMQLA
ncbi:MAG TPA: hypothetical protein VJQ82_17175, partial [Terriglobales bacterium]|nr:hypothetical protein [Terriglobales bacterium]